MARNHRDTDPTDVLVLFAITGDLAHKMIIPALYALVKRGTLTVPIIAVALPKWSEAQLHARVIDSLQKSGKFDDRKALARLLSLLSYVSGDYNDQSTFGVIKESLGKARRPAHYLALPPSLFNNVIQGLGAAGLAKDACVIGEKPFGRNLVSALEQIHGCDSK